MPDPDPDPDPDPTHAPAPAPDSGVPDPVPRLPALLEAVLSVGTDLELRATLQRIVDAAAELTGARYAELDMVEAEQDGLVEIRTADLPEHAAARRSKDTLAVPISVDDEVFGNLYLAQKHGGPFTDEDERLLRVLAPRPARRSATPGCTRRPGSASAGSRARRPSPPRCSPARMPPTR